MFSCFREHTKLLGLDYSSEHPDTKKEKSSISRKLTFRRHQETTTKEKEKRKPKRTASVNSPAGYSVQDYRGKRGKISPLNKKRHNSSGESSVASGTNLGGSIPYDLPGAVDMGDRSEFNASERPGSALTLEDVSISMGQPDTADVAVQCSPSGSSVTRYHTPASPQPPRSAGAKAEHSKRLHSVNMLSVQDNSPMTQSLPATPIKQRRSPGGFFVGGPPHSPPVPYLSERKQHHTIGSARGRRIQDELSNGRHSADQVLAEREVSFFCRTCGCGMQVDVVVCGRVMWVGRVGGYCGCGMWVLWVWHAGGYCGCGIQVDIVGVASRWILWVWHPGGYCGCGIQVDIVGVASRWILWVWHVGIVGVECR